MLLVLQLVSSPAGRKSVRCQVHDHRTGSGCQSVAHLADPHLSLRKYSVEGDCFHAGSDDSCAPHDHCAGSQLASTTVRQVHLRHYLHLSRSGSVPKVSTRPFHRRSSLTQNSRFSSHSSAYRFLVSFILLSGVVLSNSYTSGFASVLTIPRYGKSIETIHDFVQTPYRWGAPAIAWVLSLFGADSVGDPGFTSGSMSRYLNRFSTTSKPWSGSST